MRRGVGVGAIKQREDRNNKLAVVADKSTEERNKSMVETTKLFREQLEAFAVKHKKG